MNPFICPLDAAGYLSASVKTIAPPPLQLERRTMPDVEVDHVLGVHSLDADGERLRRMKREGDEAPGVGRRRKAASGQDSGVYLEPHQPAVTRVKPTDKTRSASSTTAQKLLWWLTEWPLLKSRPEFKQDISSSGIITCRKRKQASNTSVSEKYL